LWGRGTGGGDARHQRLRLEGCRLLAKADKEGGEESPGEEGARHPFGGFDDIYLLPTVRECESAAGGAGMTEWNLGRLGGGVVRRRGDDATMRRCDDATMRLSSVVRAQHATAENDAARTRRK
jgi:hypothetical protein